MGYLMTLDEYSEDSLRAELEQREQMQREDRCDYCYRDARTTPPCKFPARHNRAPGAPS